MKNLDLKHRVAKWNLCYLMLKTISYIDNCVNELVEKPLEVRDETLMKTLREMQEFRDEFALLRERRKSRGGGSGDNKRYDLTPKTKYQ